ncbi:hypothetical protein MMC31_004230, partial [Peltigera leucophlebia]|nr:hypothetical protein [Peltigera leucophlebia]
MASQGYYGQTQTQAPQYPQQSYGGGGYPQQGPPPQGYGYNEGAPVRDIVYLLSTASSRRAVPPFVSSLSVRRTEVDMDNSDDKTIARQTERL